MKKQQIHLVWGSACLGLVGLTYGLAALEEPSEPSVGPPAVRLALRPQASTTRQRALTPSAGAALTSRASSAPRATGPQAGVLEATSSSTPSEPPSAALGGAPAPFEPAPLEALRPIVDPQVAVALDPEAEALVRLLFRLRLAEGTEPKQFVAEVIANILNSLTDADKERLILALTAFDPTQKLWQYYGEGVASANLVAAHREAYDRDPSEDNFASLVEILNYQNPEGLDSQLIERLLRAHPGDESLESLLVSSAPQRAAEVFAHDGLSANERRLLIGVAARTDPSKAAAQTLELFALERQVSDLVSAMELDPKAAERFLLERRGDPVWEQLASIARLQISYDSGDSQASARAFAASWEQLSPGNLVEVLEIVANNSESWTALQSQALTRVVAAGNPELTQRVLDFAPTRERWRILAATNQRIEPGDTGNLEAERFVEFLDEEPFTAREMLATFFQIYPVLEPRDALYIAQSFQSKGDSAAAKQVLEQARLTPFVRLARQRLAEGFNLEELEEEPEETPEMESEDE